MDLNTFPDPSFSEMELKLLIKRARSAELGLEDAAVVGLLPIGVIQGGPKGLHVEFETKDEVLRVDVGSGTAMPPEVISRRPK